MSNPNDYPCPVGHYCETGSRNYTICPSGTYQDELAQWTCKECIEGFYCDNGAEPVVDVTLYECPEGQLLHVVVPVYNNAIIHLPYSCTVFCFDAGLLIFCVCLSARLLLPQRHAISH